MVEQAKLDNVGKAILKALAQLKAPARCGEIATKAGLPVQQVSSKLRGLLNGGLIATPGKGQYTLTPEGKRAAR